LEIVLSRTEFTETTAFPYWVDQSIARETSQGIYYTIHGNIPNRTVIFEYYTTLSHDKEQYCHFQVLFFENKPNIIQFIYLDVPDDDKLPIVGVQGKSVHE
jgi:hypothetical protein